MWSRLCGRRRPAAGKELSHLLFGARAFDSRRPAATHELRVWTGDARGAATRAEVFVKLFGYSGEEVHVPLSSGTFERDSLDVFEIEVPAAVSVGGIKRIEIGHDEDGLGSGWFLDHVDILPLGETKAAVAAGETGARVVSKDFYTFPCNMWLGESDSGGVSGPPIASLLPARSKPGRNRANKKKPPRRRKPHPHLRLVCFPACLPHPDKVLEGKRGSAKPHLGHGGEDAYFIEQVREAIDFVQTRGQGPMLRCQVCI